MRLRLITSQHQLKFSQLTEIEKAQLAIATDTDGCITIGYHNNRDYAYPSYIFSGATILPIELWKKYGGTLQNYRPRLYKWKITRWKALKDYLQAISPYLHLKTKQAEIALMMLELILNKPIKWKKQTLELATKLKRENTEYKYANISLESLKKNMYKEN